MKKNLVTLVFIVITVVIFVLIIRPFGPDTNIQSFEFSGKIEDILEDSLLLSGIFIPTNPGLFGSEEIQIISVKVLITNETTVKRIVRFSPSPEEVIEQDDEPRVLYYVEFNAQDLEKEEDVVDFQKIKDDFQEFGPGMIVRVKTDENVFGKKKFAADEINYETPFQER